MNITRASTGPFRSLSTAARTHIAGQVTQVAASATRLVNRSCFALSEIGFANIDLALPFELKVLRSSSLSLRTKFQEEIPLMRRTFFLTLFVLAFAGPSVLAQDPTKVDSKHYKVEFENSKVRILRVHYGPHEKSVMHRHPDSIAIFQNDGKVKFTYPGGKTEEREMKAGHHSEIRSEEHTSELQSHSDLVCRLLLEKKKKIILSHNEYAC